MWVAFALQKLLTFFFSKKFQHIFVSLGVNFNESLTNDVVSFEQLGPGLSQFVLVLTQLPAFLLLTFDLLCAYSANNKLMIFFIFFQKLYEPAHYNKTFVTSKDSDQSVHPPSMARVLVYSILDSLKAEEGTCNQRRLWSVCAGWSESSLVEQVLYCRFCRALAHSWAVT